MASAIIKYTLYRMASAVPVLLGLSMLVFGMVRIIPGDPVRVALGPQASETQVQALREEMRLDEPLPIQYVAWFQDLFQGDWGTSIRTGNNVYDDIVYTLPATVELVLYSIILAVVLSIPLGVIAASNQDKWEDHISRISALFAISMPRFWLAIVLQLIFVSALGLFPLSGRLPPGASPPSHITGLYLIDSLIALELSTFIDAAYYLALPVIAQATATIAVLMRLIRSEMIEEANKDYIWNLRAYGFPESIIKYKYTLKNSYTSSLTIIGLQFGFLIGNAFLVELVFAWPGMARYGVNAILGQDFNAIVGVVIVIGFAFTISNLVVDILYGILDPRAILED